MFSTAKVSKVTRENKQAERESFKRKVNERLWEYYQGTDLIFNKMSAIVPQYVALPEFDNENGLIFIL